MAGDAPMASKALAVLFITTNLVMLCTSGCRVRTACSKTLMLSAFMVLSPVKNGIVLFRHAHVSHPKYPARYWPPDRDIAVHNPRRARANAMAQVPTVSILAIITGSVIPIQPWPIWRNLKLRSRLTCARLLRVARLG